MLRVSAKLLQLAVLVGKVAGLPLPTEIPIFQGLEDSAIVQHLRQIDDFLGSAVDTTFATHD